MLSGYIFSLAVYDPTTIVDGISIDNNLFPISLPNKRNSVLLQISKYIILGRGEPSTDHVPFRNRLVADHVTNLSP
jgi:hypothetical protein